MINKLKNIFLLVLCVGLMGGAITNASAQTGPKQSDINKVIGFYEWAFEAKFTDDQRSQYQEIISENFQKDPAGEKKAVSDIINSFAAVQAKSESEQERLRKVFIEDYVGKLRSADEPEAKFLLSIYDGAHNANGGETTTNGGGDISAITGKWVWAHTGSSAIGTSGVYLGSNGSRFTYQFYPNGTVEFTGMMNVMQGSCNQQLFRSIKGQASLNGNTLTIHWGPEKFTRDFSCDTANNYTKTIPAKTETKQIEFKNDLGQRQLCFVGAECFSPTNK